MGSIYDSDKRYRELEKTLKQIKEFFGNKFTLLQQTLDNLDDDQINELSEYLTYFSRSHDHDSLSMDIDTDKLKVFMLLFSKLAEENDTTKIVSFFETQEYGWHNGKYHLKNDCLRRFLYDPASCCKRIDKITDTELACTILASTRKIFFSNDSGLALLVIFSYCLCALFSSRLNQEGVSVPFFLQIACDKSSALYQFILELVEICDVNSGLFECCNKHEAWDGYCGYRHQVFYPTQSTNSDLENLCYNRDIPVIISGHENEHYYNSLLRQISNLPYKRNALDWKDKFNFLPIFICTEIKSSFDNVLSIDLTDTEVSRQQLDSLQDMKKTFASWCLELVMEHNRYLFSNDNSSLRDRTLIRHPFFKHISEHTNYVSQKHSYLTLKNAQNTATLDFFFKGFLTVFLKQCTFSTEEEFAYSRINGVLVNRNCTGHIASMMQEADRIFANFHQRYVPAPKLTNIKDKDAARLAKQIEKHYRSLKVSLQVTPLEIKKDRYIFTVDTLNETKITDISRNAETVKHRLKKYEYFRADLRDSTSIKLIVAEKTLTDNSLCEIFEHKDFLNPKLKIPYAVGFDEFGNPCVEDLDNIKHLLLGGATTTGKSTAIKSLLTSIAYRHRTGDVNVIIIDLLGKDESDFSMFNDQPFLSAPIITESKEAIKAIFALQEEKTRRLKNKNLSELPHIVCVIDEFPRLFFNCNKNEEEHVTNVISDLLSSSRHANIHMVLAAQNPVKRYMKGDIANITTRIAFRCSHYQNSKAILGRGGAEKLMTRGQMIFDSIEERDRRIQGSYIVKTDLKILLRRIQLRFKQENQYPFKLSVMSNTNAPKILQPDTSIFDQILPEVIEWTLPQDRIANSRIQGKFNIGNNRAVKLLEQMEELGLIHKLHGNLGWEVIPGCYEQLSHQAIQYLKQHGKTEYEIKNMLSKKSSLDAASSTSTTIQVLDETAAGKNISKQFDSVPELMEHLNT